MGELTAQGNLGIFGGTFDPPHFAHMVLAANAIHQFSLDQVLFIISPNPPHKRNNEITDFEHRLTMLNFAIEDNHQFTLSEIDINRPGPHFAVDTMALLHGTYPNKQFTYLMGEDSLLDLPNWGRPTEFISLCNRIGVMKRHASDTRLSTLYNQLPGLENKIEWLRTPNLEISSRMIRKNVREKIPVKYYLNKKVNNYIIENKLFF